VACTPNLCVVTLPWKKLEKKSIFGEDIDRAIGYIFGLYNIYKRASSAASEQPSRRVNTQGSPENAGPDIDGPDNNGPDIAEPDNGKPNCVATLLNKL